MYKISKLSAIFVALLLALVACSSSTQHNNTQAADTTKTTTQTQQADWSELMVAFYNVENFFDTIDHPDKKDEEYTPEGFRQWNTKRMNEKIENISRVADSMETNPQWGVPAIMGFSEVENRWVMEELIKHPAFAKYNYAVAHRESPDFRGIDNALIYRKDVFDVQTVKNIAVTFDNNKNYTTRDILAVSGKLNNGSELVIMVNHWPSRSGGQQKSEPRRIRAAQVLKKAVDSVLTHHPHTNLVLMGDFNDYPHNQSIAQVLGATANGGQVTNLMAKDTFDVGTHKYDGHWGILDQIMVCNAMLAGVEGVAIKKQRANIYYAGWMLADDYYGPGLAPFRTYGGRKYLGGYSDHLPVYITLTNQK